MGHTYSEIKHSGDQYVERDHNRLYHDGEKFVQGDGTVPDVFFMGDTVHIGCRSITRDALEKLMERLTQGHGIIQRKA